MPHRLTFRLLRDRFAIHRLPPGRAIETALIASASWISITRTENELSIVAPESFDFGDAVRNAGWACLKVNQTLDFSLVGVLADISTVLARAEISIFTVSTYDTDYILVPALQLETAIRALERAGHTVNS